MGSIADQTFADLLASIAAKTPTPGGGAVASATAALAAALAQMVVSFSIGKKNLVAHEPELRAAAMRLERSRELLLGLADEDAAAYSAVNELSRLPEDHPRRAAELPEALAASIQVPLSTAAACVELLRLLVSLSGTTNRHLRSDLAIAAILADAAVRASRCNVLANTASIPDPAQRLTHTRQLASLLTEADQLRTKVERACEW